MAIWFSMLRKQVYMGKDFGFQVKCYENYWKISETHGTEPKITRKTCTRTGTGCDPKITGSFAGFLFLDPNRPGPGRNRPEPKPKSSQVPIGYKFSRPERPGPERNRPEPDPKIRMPRPNHFCPKCLCTTFTFHLLSVGPVLTWWSCL